MRCIERSMRMRSFRTCIKKRGVRLRACAVHKNIKRAIVRLLVEYTLRRARAWRVNRGRENEFLPVLRFAAFVLWRRLRPRLRLTCLWPALTSSLPSLLHFCVLRTCALERSGLEFMLARVGFGIGNGCVVFSYTQACSHKTTLRENTLFLGRNRKLYAL